MKTCVFLCVALTGVAMVEAQLSPYVVPTTMPPYPAAPFPASPVPAPTPDPGPWTPIWIKHDEVEPFPEPEPVTISEKAALKFKPELTTDSGCQPYPAVDCDGRTSSGLEPLARANYLCMIQTRGSQIYGRSIWFRGVWAIMYAWYFPQDVPPEREGRTHDWESVVVWLNNPAVQNPEIMGVSWSVYSKYKHNAPPDPKYMDGTRAQVSYYAPPNGHHTLRPSDRDGESNDLIMWEQLTENARRALNTVNWGEVKMPLNDANFQSNLGKAWPFGGKW